LPCSQHGCKLMPCCKLWLTLRGAFQRGFVNKRWPNVSHLGLRLSHSDSKMSAQNSILHPRCNHADASMPELR
jgi:hypothetical protein